MLPQPQAKAVFLVADKKAALPGFERPCARWGKQRIHGPEDYPKIASPSNEVRDLEILSPND
jgi:hypothetical protein